MTLQEIVDLARIYANMTGDTKLTDQTIVKIVNEGERSLNNYMASKKSALILTHKDFDTVASQADYTIVSAPLSLTDFLRAAGLYQVSSEGQIPEINEIEQYIAGDPHFYVKTMNTVITISPTPGSATSHRLFYFKKITPMTYANIATATPSAYLPENLHELLSLFTALRLMISDDREHANVKDLYDAKWREFEEYVFGTAEMHYDYTPAGEYATISSQSSTRPV